MRSFALIILALALSACGFHLRGAMELPFDSMYVDSSAAPTIGAELALAVRTGTKTRLAHAPTEAAAVLQVTREARDKRILSLSGAGKVREYELSYRVSFRLLDRNKQELIPDQQIELSRAMTYDDAQVLAKQAEETMLYTDMQGDAAQQIMRRVAAVKLSASNERLPAVQH
jgi:LPS-assembly lipoprotein